MFITIKIINNIWSDKLKIFDNNKYLIKLPIYWRGSTADTQTPHSKHNKDLCIYTPMYTQNLNGQIPLLRLMKQNDHWGHDISLSPAGYLRLSSVTIGILRLECLNSLTRSYLIKMEISWCSHTTFHVSK